MTKLRHDQGDTPFGRWLRLQTRLDSRDTGLSIQNLDYVIHKFRHHSTEKVMIVEEKQFMSVPSFAQRDTLQIIHYALQQQHGQWVKNARGEYHTLLYYGVHLLQFECTSPDDGGIYWDHQPITPEQLINLLQFVICSEDLRHVKEM